MDTTKIESFFFTKISLPPDNSYISCYRGGYWGDTNAYGIDLSISRKACRIRSVRYNGAEKDFSLFAYYR